MLPWRKEAWLTITLLNKGRIAMNGHRPLFVVDIHIYVRRKERGLIPTRSFGCREHNPDHCPFAELRLRSDMTT